MQLSKESKVNAKSTKLEVKGKCLKLKSRESANRKSYIRAANILEMLERSVRSESSSSHSL